jgi:hypothetical protein
LDEDNANSVSSMEALPAPKKVVAKPPPLSSGKNSSKYNASQEYLSDYDSVSFNKIVSRSRHKKNMSLVEEEQDETVEDSNQFIVETF